MSRKERRNNAARLGLPANFADALEEVTRMRDEFATVRAEVSAETRTFTSGPVTAVVNGDGRLVSLTVEGEAGPAATMAISAALTAIHAAHDEVAEYAAERLAPYTSLAATI